jgi:hypothetical protein
MAGAGNFEDTKRTRDRRSKWIAISFFEDSPQLVKASANESDQNLKQPPLAEVMCKWLFIRTVI